MAQTLSVNIDSPVAGALVGPVVHVSGTVSVVRYATWRAEERGAVRGRSGRRPVRPGAAARRSLRLGRLATYFGRSGPAGRSPVRKRHARLPSMSIWLMCGCLKAAADPPGPRRERDGTGWNRMERRTVQVLLPPVTKGETAWFAARRLVRTPWALTAARPD